MSAGFRSLFMVLMSSALFFGFLHLFVPDGETWNFERLHIFLFNLCSGGTIILYFTEDRKKPSGRTILFSLLAFVYAVCAFLKVYIWAMVISLFLAGIVEIVRIRRFSVFPTAFFRSSVPVSEKFHQAALLCLSVGLVISCLVIWNDEYLKIVSFPKLKLDTFFLGFSFPLSLITMSLMFSFMKADMRKIVGLLKNVGFWTINLGVIIFFLFILFEKLVPQLFITTVLFMAVVMIFCLFIRLGIHVQQKSFLISGMGFLLFTAVTGILYIILEFFPEYYHQNTTEFLLRLHTFASLYGWNLSGLVVICRYEDFPIRLHSKGTILFHWLTVLILAPLGIYSRAFAVCAIVCYTIFLYIVFSSEGVKFEAGNLKLEI